MKIIVKNGKKKEIECKEGQSLLEALQEAGVYLPALCAGRGTCGKCKVRILEGEVSSLEKAPEKEGLAGDKPSEKGEDRLRLACKTSPLTDVVLKLPEEAEENMVVEAAGTREEKAADQELEEKENLTEAFSPKNFIAVDIGTTTIAMVLAEQKTGEIRDTYAALNRQRMYGADVISRIAAANGGLLGELNKLITEDLGRGISQLTKGGKIPIQKVVIAANTTMVHLLMGYSCESLGKHPFSSEHLGLIKTSLGKVLTGVIPTLFAEEEKKNAEKADLAMSEEQRRLMEAAVLILPGISAFVGSDITADLLICPGFEEEGISLLLDMGTNGEMVIGNRDRLIAASTAAGPAFEGGNITCGTGSIPGAINQIRILNRRAAIGTIGGKQPPAGICGTGIIEAIAELKKNRLMDKGGLLQFPYGNMGYPLWMGNGREKIAIYQQDIRQLQLAKGAIRAGMEQLMETFGCRHEEVDRVYLAGGFGTQLPVNGAIEIGLFPEEFKGKIAAIGNGALQGALACGTMPESEENKRQEIFSSISQEKEKQLEEIKARAESLNLALADGFEERYLKYLDF